VIAFLRSQMQIRINEMTLQVPYLAVEAIERDTEALLAQFAHARGMAIRAQSRSRTSSRSI